MATALFMKMAVEMTDAKTDQEHIEMIIYNCPQIPDRTGYILGKTLEDPVPEIVRIGRRLAAEGVGLIAIPCVTAGCFYERLAGEIEVPIIDIVREVRDCLSERKLQCAGLMATSGTIASGLFQKALSSMCRLVLPDPSDQKELMHVIYDNVKANKPVETARFYKVAEHLRDAGAEVILLGCTELSVVSEICGLGGEYIDLLRLMAKCAVCRCGRLKQEYESWPFVPGNFRKERK